MALTKEELLKPRYRVIAGYFFNPYSIGDILKQSPHGGLYVTRHQQLVDGVPVDIEDYVSEESVLKYPHLFRKLEWHDGLKESELPEYVKVKVAGCSVPQGFVYKVCEWGVYPDEGRKWGNEGDFYALYIMEEATKTNDVGERITINIKNLLPADESEYNSQKQ